ncbi:MULTISPECIES: relaxase/mobilization nuclease domain-containing protein [unclassified Variovorax]|uniref:relaxase/mobilization nuclease domain-containing protein n=1 Tax=unclassified Variovorax TaxID=663243 RepID=UPI00210A1189|nr:MULTISPECIES: relaxase/mobilization nuclease domain-containing protein [unclassified Variovorax]
MPKRIVSLPRTAGMELDIVSYGRRGPGGTLRLNPEQVEQVKRTTSRVPEVMVKVSGGARDCGGARAHLKYIGRHGKVEIETDDGLTLQGRDVADGLLVDWQLDLCPSQYKPKPREGQKDTRAKLVHNIVLSMPSGTPPEKVLRAARDFARENFALQYRYAMALHTDQAHPHVHLVVKCQHETEPGKRLYIRKETLRQWREQFAALMREQGVAANATPRQIRGQMKTPSKDPIHHRLRAVRAFQSLPSNERAGRRPPAPSTFFRRKVESVGEDLRSRQALPDPGRATLSATRGQVEADWKATIEALRLQGDEALAKQVERFVVAMPPVRTDREQMASRLLEALKARRGARDSDGRDQSKDRSR